ncbi:MAG: phenylalanine--tRNA ligase subunit alpha [Holosporales bacterium]|jgi:phenylalanyl-tRNA synthetase alpha chain|nr:phenylalanine--tRNA ligase subunit alpha [Holosporales bacterium]
MPFKEIESSLQHWIDVIQKTSSVSELDKFKVAIMGKSSLFTAAFKFIGSLSVDEKKTYGEKLNIAKEKLEFVFREQKLKIAQMEMENSLKNEKVDVTLPVANSNIGGSHIISTNIKRIRKHYHSRGFLVLDGPEIDSEFNNFDALNIPMHHPARQSHDTFYIENFSGMLLRTHTSTVQIRAMMQRGVPIRMISVGKTYRNDSLDATHSPMFHQIEGLVVDTKPLCIGHLKSELQKLIAFFFEIDNISEVNIRLRPSYFPFTEPGMEVDCKYNKKDENDSWLELGGAGMVHPNVYRACELPEELYGFAFGFGVERLVMLKYGIQDIRNLYNTDIRWLKHYA